MTDLRVVIADDEPLARKKLLKLIGAHPRLMCIGEAADGLSAVEMINELKPELAFLDIRMPGLTGLEVVQRIVHQPLVIFTTAYDEFAVTAFELQALDYLLKPFGPKRFNRAVDRLKTVLLPEHRQRLPIQQPMERFFVRERGKIIAIASKEVLRFEAADDYVEIVTASSRHLLSVRMKALENHLPPQKFLRVHRSTIVNMEFVREIVSLGNGRYEVAQSDGTHIAASRSGGSKIRDILNKSRRRGTTD